MGEEKLVRQNGYSRKTARGEGESSLHHPRATKVVGVVVQVEEGGGGKSNFQVLSEDSFELLSLKIHNYV